MLTLNSLQYFGLTIPIIDEQGWAFEFDFYSSPQKYKDKIDKTLDRIISNASFSKCEDTFIDCISTLQSNRFLSDLVIAQNQNFNSTLIFEDILNSLNEFKSINNQLKKFNSDYKEKSVIELTPEQEQKFQTSINDPTIHAQDIFTAYMFI
jgi:ABC-type enterochelin transport system ATPase subunit